MYLNGSDINVVGLSLEWVHWPVPEWLYLVNVWLSAPPRPKPVREWEWEREFVRRLYTVCQPNILGLSFRRKWEQRNHNNGNSSGLWPHSTAALLEPPRGTNKTRRYDLGYDWRWSYSDWQFQLFISFRISQSMHSWKNWGGPLCDEKLSYFLKWKSVFEQIVRRLFISNERNW